MKQFFTLRNLFWGFVVGLAFAGLSLWAMGSFFWGPLIFIPICTIGCPLIRYRDAELAKIDEDRV